MLPTVTPARSAALEFPGRAGAALELYNREAQRQFDASMPRCPNPDCGGEGKPPKTFGERGKLLMHMRTCCPDLLEQLEVCQKALSGYLDQKRAAFPRFYFVSDAVLLEILSQGSNPENIQHHLSSVFDSIDEATFDKKGQVIRIASGEGQSVDLVAPVLKAPQIEDLLNSLLLAMQATVNGVVQAAAIDCETMAIEPFTYKYPAQVSLIGIQFMWTLDAEDALFRSKSEKGVMNAVNRKNPVSYTHLRAHET